MLFLKLYKTEESGMFFIGGAGTWENLLLLQLIDVLFVGFGQQWSSMAEMINTHQLLATFVDC